jgi:hypothetical protein
MNDFNKLQKIQTDFYFILLNLSNKLIFLLKKKGRGELTPKHQWQPKWLSVVLGRLLQLQ